MLHRAGFLRILGALLLVAVGGREGLAQSLKISTATRQGLITWTNLTKTTVTIAERSTSLSGPWSGIKNIFVTNAPFATSANVGLTNWDASTMFVRLRSLNLSGTPAGFTNLLAAYGVLETIAGTGLGQIDNVSFWQPWNEGAPAVWAGLSRPHFAMADRAGNIYIADKNSHSILRVGLDGNIYTHAGSHTGGFNGDGPAVATSLNLNYPNGEWVKGDGTVYVFDTDNGRIRKVSTNGVMSTLFMATSDGSAVSGGRGLWVSEDETQAYFCAGTRIRRWTPAAGVKTLASGFNELGDLIVEPNGDVVACDRGGSRVYRITSTGTVTTIAGTGDTFGGGDGGSALQTALYGARGIWPVPTGGYLILTHEGCQLWYLDTAGILHVLLNGARGSTHSGDGGYFYGPDAKISEGRSVSMDYEGNIIVCESDYGYVRRIRFLPGP